MLYIYPTCIRIIIYPRIICQLRFFNYSFFGFTYPAVTKQCIATIAINTANSD